MIEGHENLILIQSIPEALHKIQYRTSVLLGLLFEIHFLLFFCTGEWEPAPAQEQPQEVPLDPDIHTLDETDVSLYSCDTLSIELILTDWNLSWHAGLNYENLKAGLALGCIESHIDYWAWVPFVLNTVGDIVCSVE